MSIAVFSRGIACTLRKAGYASLSRRYFSEVPIECPSVNNRAMSLFSYSKLTYRVISKDPFMCKPGDFDKVLKVYMVTNGNFKENAYILYDSELCDGAVVDPGMDGYKLLKAIEVCQTNISKVFLTHSHKNHVFCIPDLITSFGAMPVYMHESERTNFDLTMKDSIKSGIPLDVQYLKDQDPISVSRHTGTAIHTPGHTPGSMCFLFGGFLFSGDTLMCNKIGTTNDNDSNEEQLKSSIASKLFTLKKETLVLGGHGPLSSIATEFIYNPILGTHVKK